MRVLGIDIGNTAAKAGIFNSTGDVIASAVKVHRALHPGPGEVELDTPQVLEDIVSVIRACTRLCPEVDALAVSCMAEAFTPIAADGVPWFRCMLTQDTRAIKECAEFAAAFDPDRVKEVTGQQIHEKFPAPKIRWLAKHHPEKTQTSTCFSSWQGLTCMLLGFPPHCDYSIAGKTMLFDISQKKWDLELVRFAGISASQLDTPVPSGTALGPLSPRICKKLGFRKPPLLVMGAFDQICANIGSGASALSEGTLGMGTVFCMVNRLLETQRTALPPAFPAIPDVQPGRIISTASVLTGGQAYDWLHRNCYTSSPDVHSAIAAELPAGPSGVLFFPYLAGSGTPTANAKARGAFLGLAVGHDRGTLMKAVMEGVAYELRLNLERIEQTGGVKQRLIVSGGCSRSGEWLQILSDILHKEIAVSPITEAGCLGAGMIAAYGAGFFPNLNAAVLAMRCPPRRGCKPDPDMCGAYDKFYTLYRAAYPSVISASESLSEI